MGLEPVNKITFDAALSSADAQSSYHIKSSDIEESLFSSDLSRPKISKIEYDLYNKQKILYYKDGLPKIETIQQKKDFILKHNSMPRTFNVPASEKKSELNEKKDPVINTDPPKPAPLPKKQKEDYNKVLEDYNPAVYEKKERGVMFMPGVPVSRVIRQSDKNN